MNFAELRRTIRADLRVNGKNPRARVTVVLLRLSAYTRRSRNPLLRVAGRLVSALYVVLSDWLFGVQIPWATKIGPGLRIAHGVGLVVNGRSVIGSNVTLRQGVTLAGKRTGSDAPTLGDNVNVGANVTIVGPITIGDGARIGAGAVVVTDVPAGAIAVGNPARVLPKRTDDRGQDPTPTPR